MSAAGATALAASCARCHDCGLLCRLPSPAAHGAHCARCGAELHLRKPHSLERTWALVIAAALCYVPANVLPVMMVTSLGQVESDTILSGVIYFLMHGMWPLAIVVFVASVFVPVLKLAILGFLLISVQRGSSWRPVERTRLYRITHAIGRWSMVDIFAITILAAESFDPRLIWDQSEARNP